MPTPVQEQLVAAIKTALDGISAIAGLTAEREREEMVETDEIPFLALYELEVTPQEEFAGEDGWSLAVQIEGLAQGATRVAARQAAAELRAEVVKAVLADRTLGGLARDVLSSNELAPAQLDYKVADTVAEFAVAFDVLFATAEGNPFSLP